jgi:hypothetical protein
MTDAPSNGPAPAAAAPPARRRWWHYWKLILAGAVFAPLLGVVLYTMAALSWDYSNGERAGTLTKFSRKGWLCKTWEGELMMPSAPGVAPVLWNFSVRGDSVAVEINRGIGKRVVLRYREHRGVPTSCFAETDYFVDAIKIEP